LHLIAQKTHKKNCIVIFFGVEGCAVDHPRTTIIKEEEEEEKNCTFSNILQKVKSYFFVNIYLSPCDSH
jgi:hypothetical protein